MSQLLAIFCFVIGSVWTLGAAGMTVRILIHRGPIWRRVLAILGGYLMATGAIGFVGTGVLSLGVLHWPAENQEYPVGYASGVITMPPSLDHVVPLSDISRIQVYDRDWHFLTGWNIVPPVKDFKLRQWSKNSIEAYAYREDHYYVLLFTVDGRLISQSNSDMNTLNAIPAGESFFVPTPIYLLPFAGPLFGWFSGAIGLVTLLLIQMSLGLLKPRSGRSIFAQLANGKQMKRSPL